MPMNPRKPSTGTGHSEPFSTFMSTSAMSRKPGTRKILEGLSALQTQSSPVAGGLPEGVTLNNDLDDLYTESTTQGQASGAKSSGLTLLRRPPVLIAMSLLGIAICASYAGLGYLRAASANDGQSLASMLTPSFFSAAPQTATNEQAPEPALGMAAVDENNTLLAQATPTTNQTTTTTTTTTGKAPDSDIADIRRDLQEPSGRHDPFSPLVKEPVPGSNTGVPGGMSGFGNLGMLKPVKRDGFLDVAYSGFIGDTGAKDAVAIIKVNDIAGGGVKTLIKKTGDTFYIGNDQAQLKSLTKTAMLVKLGKTTRWVPLYAYQELVPATVNGATTTPPGGGSITLFPPPAANSASTNVYGGMAFPTGITGSDK